MATFAKLLGNCGNGSGWTLTCHSQGSGSGSIFATLRKLSSANINGIASTSGNNFQQQRLSSKPFHYSKHCHKGSSLLQLQSHTTRHFNLHRPGVFNRRMLSSTCSLLNQKPHEQTTTSNSSKPEDSKGQEAKSVSVAASAGAPEETQLSTKEKLKQAVRDYGATVIIFHIAMSLTSLGFFYLLVSSGLDVMVILEKIGISESLLKSKVTEEASKFVVAYAVHKIFAPVRITITLSATPFIVKKLRSMGVLKQVVKAKTS